ncbi:MAG: guanylate kinase [candidate division KSB1 bacterium]|nr:guanylate kinase [candidate division KSB1 bacterium]MDZ7399150.1 guanylate kinase [candidate division KSB1 bacterium]
MQGLLIILSSPSGGGKTSVIQKILARDPERFVYSISATTRKPRPGEIDGKDYFFMTESEFRQGIENGKFLEWESVHGHLYGTPRDYIDSCLKKGKHILFDIDVNGALKVAKVLPEQTLTIFLAPPSIETLIQRLKSRNTDSAEEINTRLQRIPMEMEKARLFDYVVVNQDLDTTVAQVLEIIDNFSKQKSDALAQ